MILPALLACQEAHAPFAEPLLADWTPHREACDDLRVVGRLRLGGTHGAAAATARADVAVATEDGLVVLDRTDLRVVAEHVLPGEALDVAAEPGGALWVAAGTAGIVRVRDPYAPGAPDVWPTGGVVTRIAVDRGAVWAVDPTGRVLHLPWDATPDAVPRALVVDGRPAAVAVEDGDALVALGNAGAVRVHATASAIVPRTLVPSGVVTSRLGGGFFAAGPIVRRDQQQVQLGDGVLDLEEGRDGVYVAARRAGVVFWNGQTAPVGWDPGPAAGRPAFHPSAVAWVQAVPGGADRLAIAGRTGGTALVDAVGAQGIRALAVSEPGGAVGAILAFPGGVAVAIATFNESGRIAILARGPDGVLAVGETVDAGGRPRALALDGTRLLVARDGPGAGVLDLAAAERAVIGVPDTPRLTSAFVPAGPGEWVAVGRERDLVWIEAVGGTVTARLHDPVGRQVAGAGAVGGRMFLVDAQQGRVRLTDRHGEGPAWLLAGAIPDAVYPAGAAAIGGALWIPAPDLGVQLVDPDRGLLDVLTLPGGAWAATAWGDEVALAAGTGGVVLARRTGDRVEVVGRCDLPGDARAITADGDRLLVGTGGVVVELARP